MPQRTMPGASWGQTEAPPSYENALTPLEFEQKTASVVQQSLQEVRHHDSGPADNGKKRATEFNEFEDWDDAKFEAAAAAYRARQARQQKNTSSSGGTSSSTDRTQSPRGEPSSTSQQPSGSGYEPSSSQSNPGQLPSHSKADSVSPRGLPLRPIDIYSEPGPAPLPASEYPADVKDPRFWMEKQPEEHHGRPSLEGPPPFTSMASPTSTEEESAPQAEAIRGSRDNSMGSTTYGNVPPPPPISRAQMTATPPAPTFHSPQRYSEIPLSTTTSHHYQPPQRHSDIPSPLHSNPPRPQTIYREHPLGPERSTLYGEPYSRSRELYASANSNMGGPTISIDLRKLPLHNQSSSLDSPGDSVTHTSFYSSSVSAYLTKRPLPQPRRTATTQSQYDGYVQPNSASTPSTAYSSPAYGQPTYSNYNPSNGSMPPFSNQYGAPAVYPNHQQAQPYMNTYQSPLPQPAQQFQTPVFHQQAPGNQNYWPPQPGHWSSANYGRP